MQDSFNYLLQNCFVSSVIVWYLRLMEINKKKFLDIPNCFHHAGVGMQDKLWGAVAYPPLPRIYTKCKTDNNIFYYTSWSSWSYTFSPFNCSPCSVYLPKWQKLFIIQATNLFISKNNVIICVAFIQCVYEWIWWLRHLTITFFGTYKILYCK